jgi:sigma-E factor negative regulatory protein RseB
VHSGLAYASDLIEQSAARTHDVLSGIQKAAQTLNYQGLFAFHENGEMHSLRIIHRFDGQNQQERLIELDDMPREYVRLNQTVQCFMPDLKTILIEPAHNRRFPDLSLADIDSVLKNYSLWADSKPHRVAGRACQRYEIRPRDSYRRAYNLCVDTQNGLLLKSQSINRLGNVVEQVAFSEINIGEDISDAALKPSWSTDGWQVIEPVQKQIDLEALGWQFTPVAGFNHQKQMSRMLAPNEWVHQVVLSDGLAVMSIFIEPYRAQQSDLIAARSGQVGSVNVYAQQKEDYLVTVLGEVPPDTLVKILKSIEYQPAKVSAEKIR